MPHAGLMDEDELGPVDAPLQRARLHIRGARRRLRQGKIAAGIVTLYDALEGAMRYYISHPGHRNLLDLRPGENINEEKTQYAVLTRSGVIDGRFDFASFDRLTERALHQELPGYDYREVLAGIESLMTQLGVMPFDETTLPPEDPKTY